MTRREVATSALSGLLVGAGILFAFGARVVIAIAAGHRWNVAADFLGVPRWKR